MPERIQRKRMKGWRMPEGAVYVGRPTKWGNPFQAGKVVYLTGPKTGERADRADVVRMYENRIRRVGGDEVIGLIRAELAGRDLVCWCPQDEPCHADVLLRIANETTGR